MKFKRKAKDSGNKVNKPLLLQLILIIVVFMLITCAAGCKTGGKRVNPNSAGTIIRTSELKKRTPPPKITQPLSTPAVLTNAVKSAPIPTKPKSVKATPADKEITKGAGKIKPFTATINPTPVKLPPIKAEKLPAKIIEGDNGCAVITDGNNKTDSHNETNNNSKAGNDNKINAVPLEKKKANVNWLELLTFYMICITGAIALWIIYDLIRDSRRMKKQGSPINKHLENLKKPAKGTRAERKKTTKKKITRKKKK